MSDKGLSSGTGPPQGQPEAAAPPADAGEVAEDPTGAAGSTAGIVPTPASDESTATSTDGAPAATARRKRRRGSRGGRNRSKARSDTPRTEVTAAPPAPAGGDGQRAAPDDGRQPTAGKDGGPSEGDRLAAAAASGVTEDRTPAELPDVPGEGRVSALDAAERALVKAPPRVMPAKPKIGDTIPVEALRPPPEPSPGEAGQKTAAGGKRRRRGGRRRRGRGGSEASPPNQPVEAMLPGAPVDLDDEVFEQRRGRERKGRPVGRYMMCVHVTDRATQIAVLEGRSLIEHYVSRPSDDVSHIHGNIYLGRVQNVLPGMEAAFVDIGTPKNAVLYRGDVQYDREDLDTSGPPRIEHVLKAGQTIVCQVTKNPIGIKGARLTQEVSLPGRFVVLIPNSATYGISKRLADDERRRLRQILDRVKPAQHGIIVRTAAEGVTTDEIENDVRRLVEQWEQIEALAKRSKAPALLYREPDISLRAIREEFNKDYRSVLIDDRALYQQVRDYVASISPALADRVELYEPVEDGLPLFERYHVHEQIHRALDRKVWLPSGGSLIIEHTEALTVIDVNTGKNVGTSSLEETVFKNNIEAAVEVARQLRLRDIGGIIVVDFIDMERRDNREEVVRVFRDALSRDKTRTQVFEISELGLCEMTRKRIGEGLLESFAERCPECDGRGVLFDPELLPD